MDFLAFKKISKFRKSGSAEKQSAFYNENDDVVIGLWKKQDCHCEGKWFKKAEKKEKRPKLSKLSNLFDDS